MSTVNGQSHIQLVITHLRPLKQILELFTALKKEFVVQAGKTSSGIKI